MYKFKANCKYISLVLIIFFSCQSDNKKSQTSTSIPEVVVTSAMKNVMRKGELFGKIKLDTLSKKGLYGLGPQDYLQGEILINNGVVYLSKAVTDSTQVVFNIDKVLAPFFVHTHVLDWQSENLPKSIKSIEDLEKHIKTKTSHIETPFAFKLEGVINSAKIHIQNLPVGTKVTSPEEAHKGQVNYLLKDESATIIGFYSENHKGIFTHHDSFLHMHLITKDETKMGHLDAVEFKEMRLYLPSAVTKVSTP